jgi:hypothetical protein
LHMSCGTVCWCMTFECMLCIIHEGCDALEWEETCCSMRCMVPVHTATCSYTPPPAQTLLALEVLSGGVILVVCIHLGVACNITSALG